MGRFPLRRQKLLEETRLLRLQRRREEAALGAAGDPATGRGFKEHLAVITAAVTVIGGLLAVGLQYHQLLDAQTRAARTEVDQKLIELSSRLHDPGADAEQQANAALLLSYFGRTAAPLLLLRLRTAEDPEPILDGLALLRQHEKNSNRWWCFGCAQREEWFEDRLIEEAEKVLDLDRWSPDEPETGLVNFSRALGRLVELEKEPARRILRDAQREMAQLGRSIDHDRYPDFKDKRYFVEEALERALRSLGDV